MSISSDEQTSGTGAEPAGSLAGAPDPGGPDDRADSADLTDRAGREGVVDPADPGDPEGLVDPGRVATARAHLPAAADVADTADVFSLLGDPGRLSLLLALLDGELCVHDLAAVAGQSESSTSHALKLLRAHRVVAPRREGRRVYYRLDDPHVRMLLDLALAHTAHTEATHPEREGES